jgi:hypothetical protein
MLVYPKGTSGVPVGIPCDPWCSPVGSAGCLRLAWSWHLVAWKPSYFLSVMWLGEAFYELGFRVPKF